MSVAIRRARLADVGGIAAAHVDSIRSIGVRYCEADIVSERAARVEDALYVDATARGEAFFIASASAGDSAEVPGFSSHRIDDTEHRTAVYVSGTAARLGIGSALYRAAEAAAIAAGATRIHVDGSLAAVDFYKANGFEEIGRGEHRPRTGRPMACVFMRKNLAATARSVSSAIRSSLAISSK